MSKRKQRAPDPVVRQLRHLRETAWLSQRDVGDQLGRHQSVISELETGGTSPLLATVQQYAALFGHKLVLVPMKKAEDIDPLPPEEESMFEEDL